MQNRAPKIPELFVPLREKDAERLVNEANLGEAG